MALKDIRPFDHAVLPVEDLSLARARHEALGFTVAPDARHPFGTENACVYFDDDTYLEPLAVAQREDCERTASKGNQFTRRDQTYRFRNGDNGFSAIAFKTDHADADHKAFQKQGLSGGRKLIFGRTFKTRDGEKLRATFKLVFASDLRAPDFFAFAVQRLQTLPSDKGALVKHANGVTGIAEIIMTEDNPSDFQYFLQDFTGQRETEAHSFGMEMQLPNVRLNVMTPEAMRVTFGVQSKRKGRGLRLEGIVFERDGGALPASARRVGQFVVADPAPGQGAFYAFTDHA
ncbi:MAG: VOC family protein [Pseudomonadota bacterium]